MYVSFNYTKSGVTSGTGATYPYRATEFTLGFLRGPYCSIFSVLCRILCIIVCCPVVPILFDHCIVCTSSIYSFPIPRFWAYLMKVIPETPIAKLDIYVFIKTSICVAGGSCFICCFYLLTYTRCSCHLIVAWRVTLVEQELPILPDHLSSLLFFVGFILLDL